MTTQTDVAQLYTAFFDRAPDAAGLAYWVDQVTAGSINLAQIAQNWVEQQPEGQAKYPAGTSDADFITAIYNNVLGRSADTDGAQYWQDQLASGAVSRDVFIAAIINGAHANTSAQGQLDAQLLDNKASAGLAFANAGLNDTTLAAKVLTTVTASDASLSSTMSLIKLIPTGSALTPALVTKFSDTLDKVAALVAGQPSEQADLATYLSTLSGSVTSATNLDTLLGKIGTVATTALTDTHALDNPATLASTDAAASTPTTGGGTTTPPADPTLTAISADGLLKIDGTSTADVRVDMTAHTVTSGDKTVAIKGDATFTGVDATDYKGDVTAVGTVKEIVSGAPVYNNVTTEVVDKAQTILNWSEYLEGVSKISVLDNAAGTLTEDGYKLLDTLTGGHAWSYDLRDSVDELAEIAGQDILTNATKVVVADTLVNLATDAGKAAIVEHPEYTVRDTYAHITAASTDPLLTGAAHTIVHDTVAGVQAAVTAEFIGDADEYEVEDSAANLLAINKTDATFLKGPSSVTVTGDDAGTLNLADRDALGKVTDDDFWAYSITDTAENIVATALGNHIDYLQKAEDVTVSDSVTLAQAATIVGQGLDASGWKFSIVDSVANTNGADLGGVALTATASADVDALDGNISTGAVTFSFAKPEDAATFAFASNGFSSTGAVDSFTHFEATDKIDLTAFQLTGQDTSAFVVGGKTQVSDGQFALIKGVALVDGAYTASDAADAGTLVVWDANTTANAITQVGVWVPNANVDASALVTAAAAAVA